MKFFPQKWSFESDKNGTVQVVEWLWSVEVYAGGFQQSGPYVTELWKQALKKVLRPKNIKKILVLGVCAGDNIRLAQQRFKRAEIVAIEWDQAMTDMAFKLKRFKPVTFICGDLRDVLPTLDSQFDLILVDAFYGDNPDVNETDPALGNTFARLLSPDGVLILNAVHRFECIDYTARFLTLKKQWRFRVNTVTLFEI